MREPIPKVDGDEVEFSSASISGGLRLWFGLICLGPIIAALQDPSAIGTWQIIVAAVFGLIGFGMAGPFAKNVGVSVTWRRSAQTLSFDGQVVEDIGAVCLRRGRQQADHGDTSTQFQLLRRAPILDAVSGRIDEALDGERTGRVSRSTFEAGFSLDALEVIGVLDKSVTDAFGLALATDLAVLMDVPLIVADTVSDANDAEETENTVDPEPATSPGPWVRFWSAAELQTPLVGRFGRTEQVPADDADDDGRDIRASLRSPDLAIGGVAAVAWYGILSLIYDTSLLVYLGGTVAALGVLASIFVPTRTHFDGRSVVVRRFRTTRIPIERIVHMGFVPGQTDTLVILTDSSPLNCAIAASYGELEELRVCLLGGIAQATRRVEPGAFVSTQRPELGFLPTAAPNLDVPAIDRGEVETTGDVLSIGGQAVHLDEPLRAFLSIVPDRSGAPILHLELRQRRAGVWTRTGVRARAASLGGDALAGLPELAHPFPFVQPETMRRLLARVRFAQQEVCTEECWL